MLIYKDCTDFSEGLQYTCDPCNIAEGGRVRSLCLIKKGTTLPNPLTLQAIEILIAQEKLWIMPETTGTFDGGTPKMISGYGDNKERKVGYDYVLMVKDAAFSDNYAFWQAVENIQDWNVAFRTETQLAVVYADCTITTKAPVEESIDTVVEWNVEVKWFSKSKPEILTYPANLFEGLFKTSEYITTLSIGSGTSTPQKVYLKVDSNKTCYVVLPNGVLLTSTAGIIDYNWTGAAGGVTLVVPKNSSSVDFSDTDFYGDTLTVIGSYNLFFRDDSPGSLNDVIKNVIANKVPFISAYSRGIETVSCKKSINTNLGNNALTLATVKTILDDAYTLYLAGQLTGSINLSGGTNAYLNPAEYSTIYGITYGALIDDMAIVGWSITLNITDP